MYLLRWLELSHTKRSFEGLKELIVKEQFIDSCPKELAIHLRERAPDTTVQIAKIADQYMYLEAHGKHLFSSVSKKPQVEPKAEISFEEKCGVLYRLYKHPYVNGGKRLKQVMVPETLKRPIMEVAHESARTNMTADLYLIFPFI